MRHHRMLILLFAATLVTATALAFTSAARAEDTIVKLVSAENGKCLTSAQPIAPQKIVAHPGTAHFSASGLNTLVVSHSGRLSASATRRASAAT
jgi:ABC-type glycerol-3-phosphate transport system substrate-binding protein